MAKAKKQEKSIEQRLEEALVLYEKTPYDLPSNWCWTTFEQIANLYTGNSINEREKELKYTGLSEGYNYIATKDIGFDYEIEYENGIKIPYEETRFKKARKGASLLCIEGGSAGRKLGFLQEEVCFVNKLSCFDFHGLVDKLYFYYLQSNEFFNLFNANKVGLIGGVSVNNLKQIAVPLAPLEEQKRIEEIIEKQFAKLDEARDLIQKSLDSFADRKSAILHKAFTGNIFNHKVRMDFKRLDEISEIISGFAFDSNDFSSNNQLGCVKITNVGVGEFYPEYNGELLPLEYLQRYGKFVVRKGDILIALTRSFINAGLKVCLYESEKPALLNQRVASIRGTNNKYLYYYLQSTEVLEYVKQHSKITNQPNLSIKDLKGMIIPVPSIKEQEEIVRILDSIFEKEDKSRELIDMLDKIDEMKKSILARAFRGQLGTSNPTDEPATDLLRKILEQSN